MELKESCYGSTVNSTMTTSTLNPVTTFTPPESCESMFDSMFYTVVLFPAICAIGEAVFLLVDQFCKYREGRLIKDGVELQ